MAAVDSLRTGLSKAFDVLSDQFTPNATVILCSISDTTDAFTDLLTVSSKRLFAYSNYRKNLLLEIADTSSALTTAMASATHLKINNDYWTIIQSDTIEPTGFNPVWQIFAEKFENRRTTYRAL